MQTRVLGNSDFHISVLGFGHGTIEEAYARDPGSDPTPAMERALGAGVNWIASTFADVAPRVLDGSRGERPYVFTRCIEATWTRDGPEVRVPRDAAGIHRACAKSRGQLQTDTIDLYQIDWPAAGHSAWHQEAWFALANLQKDGSVREIGLVDCGTEQLRAAQEIAPVTALQVQLSLLNTPEHREALEFCRANQIGVLGRLPLLARALPRGSRYEAGTRMRLALTLGVCTYDEWTRNPRAVEPRLDRALAVVDELSRIGAAQGRSADSIAIAWAARLPGVTGIVMDNPGAEEVPALVGDGTFHLADEDFARIEAARSR